MMSWAKLCVVVYARWSMRVENSVTMFSTSLLAGKVVEDDNARRAEDDPVVHGL